MSLRVSPFWRRLTVKDLRKNPLPRFLLEHSGGLITMQVTLMQAKLYPNGEFTVSVLDDKKAKIDRVLTRESQEEASWRSIVAAHMEVFGVQETVRICQQISDQLGLPPVLDVLDRCSAETGTIGLSNVLNSRQSGKGSLRGQRGISAYARRLVRNAAYGLEQMHDKSTLSFLTLTLPPMTGNEFKTLMKEHWSKCTKKFLDWLSTRLKRARLPLRWCGVTEIQEKRFYREGLPFPHLHLVFIGRHMRKGWVISPLEARKEWKRILQSTGLPSMVCPDTSWEATENLVQVKKSVEAYLGKYLSKGCSAASHPKLEAFWGYLPTNWHFISQDLKDWIKRNTKSSPAIAHFLCTLCEERDSEWLQWVFPININWGDIKLLVGFSGKLTRSRIKWALSLIETHHA